MPTMISSMPTASTPFQMKLRDSCFEVIDMSKTKNAFAFRNFNSTRILQRSFFKNFYFEPNKSDEEILQSLNNTTNESVGSSEKKLYMIQAILERLGVFRHLIDRHNETRLNKYNKKKWN